VRLIEMAVAGSHSPAIFAHACKRVGWFETEAGKLSYAPMASCDKKLITKSLRGSLGDATDSDAGAPPRARTSGENADALLTNGSAAAARAKEVMLKVWNLQPKSATGEAGDGADEAAALTIKRSRTAHGSRQKVSSSPRRRRPRPRRRGPSSPSSTPAMTSTSA
jgi:hypothetical protein